MIKIYDFPHKFVFIFKTNSADSASIRELRALYSHKARVRTLFKPIRARVILALYYILRPYQTRQLRDETDLDESFLHLHYHKRVVKREIASSNDYIQRQKKNTKCYSPLLLHTLVSQAFPFRLRVP